MNKYVDMHMHTSYSDGSENIEKLFKLAKDNSISAISITDHDYSDHYEQILEYSVKYKIETIQGIEISTYYNDREIHILAYGYNTSNKLLTSQIKRIREDRNIRAEKIINNLNRLYSFNLDFNELLDISKTNIGRPHIAKLLIQHKICTTQHEAFIKYLNNESPAYVSKYRLDTMRAVELIKKSGAISVLAHFGRYKLNTNLLNDLLKSGLQGIEVLHPSHNTTTVLILKEFAKSNNLFITGGSDFHGHNSNVKLGAQKVPYEYFETLKNALQL